MRRFAVYSPTLGQREDFPSSNVLMTQCADRNDIQPMRFLVAQMMVIIMCWISTCTLKCLWRGDITHSHIMIDSIACLDFFRIFFLHSLCRFACLYPTFKASVIFKFDLLSLFCLPISFFRSLSLCALFVFSFCQTVNQSTFFCFYVFTAFTVMALLTLRCQPTSIPWFFVEFRKGLINLARRTSLGYDFLSHIRFLSKRVWLEPVGGTILPSGSLIMTEKRRAVK